MKNVKKFLSIILCLSMVLSLCACGNGSTKETEQGTAAGAKEPDAPAKVEEKNGTYTLREYLSTGETIWYELSEIKGKDSYVNNIYVIEPNGTMYFIEGLGRTHAIPALPSYRLGELEQMEDADIVAMVKELYIDTYAIFPYASYLQWDEETLLRMLTGYLIAAFPHSPDAVSFENHKEYLRDVHDDFMYALVIEQWDTVEEMNALWVAMQEGFEDKGVLWCRDAGGESPFSSEEAFEFAYSHAHENGAISDSDYELLKTTTEKIRSMAEEAAKAMYISMQEKIENRRENVILPQYKLAIISDSTGNNTDHMLMVYTDPLQQNVTVKEKNLYWFGAPTGAGNTNMIVYDSEYNGYNTKKGVLYTRLNSSVQLVLDQIGECDLPIDVKDVKTLFN